MNAKKYRSAREDFENFRSGVLRLVDTSDRTWKRRLAKKAGVSYDSLHSMVTRRRSLSETLQERVAEALDLSRGEIIKQGQAVREPEIGQPRQPSLVSPPTKEAWDGVFSYYNNLTPSQVMNSLRRPPVAADEFHYIPFAEAVLSAGGGSLQLEARVKSHLAFQSSWLYQRGHPDHMVVMSVFGDSMEPLIMEGDVVLIDQSQDKLVPKKIYAVRYDGQLFIKRLIKENDVLMLHSDNQDAPSYTVSLKKPEELSMEEPLDSEEPVDDFKILGRVIWVGRDCTYL